MKNKKSYRFPDLGFEIWSENLPDAGMHKDKELNDAMPGWRYPTKVEFNFLNSLSDLGVMEVSDGGYTIMIPTPVGGDPNRTYYTSAKREAVPDRNFKQRSSTKFYLRPFKDI